MSTATLPSTFVTRQKNQFVQEFMHQWGAKTEGISPGQYVRGIILGFETTEFGTKNIILRTLQDEELRPYRLKVFGCGSLMKQLHQEQQAPFNTLIYNAGDVVEITFTGSFVANKGLAKGKTIATFTINELVGYQFTEADITDMEKYQMEEAYKKPMQVIRTPQTRGFQPGQVSHKEPKITGNYLKAKIPVVVDDEDNFDI